MTSHHLSTDAQPRFWKLFALSVLPIAAAVVVGLWLAGRIHPDPALQSQAQRTEEVVAQDRLLVDALWSAIETVKTRALSLEQVRDAQYRSDSRKPTAAPEGPILHWAELEVKDGKLAGVRQTARNPGFQPASGWEAFEGFYLQAALSRLNLHELQENGVTLLRIKQGAGRSQEWLALAFNGSAQAGGSSIVLALVDPAEVFPIFRRWTSRSEGGNLRGYLVGSDGFVLVHSQHPYDASDFSATQVFEQGVRDMLQGRVRNGAGTFKAIDQVSVTAAYARPGTLPLGAVVERVNPKSESGAVLASASYLLRSAPGEGLQALLLGLGLALVCALGVRRLIARASVPRYVAQVLPEAEAIAYHPREAQEISPDEQPSIPGAPPFESSAAEAEAKLFDELLSDDAADPSETARRSERVALAQFETEVQQVQDPKQVAQSLAQTASQLAGAPALFFSYRESLRACMLQAHAGLPIGTSTDALSFRMTDSMLARVSRYQKEGRTASLSDDPNLCLLLAKRLGGGRCEAWPVTGHAGKLLGVLVLLGQGGPASHSPGASESMDQIMRASASHIESFRERVRDV